MKKGKSVFLACFTCLVLILGSSSTFAASLATSSATIQWSTLFFPTGTPSFTNKISSSVARAEDDGGVDPDSQTLPGWVLTEASAAVLNATGDAVTSDTVLDEIVTATADGISTTHALADASAERSGVFTAPSTGFVAVSVDWELSMELTTDFLVKRHMVMRPHCYV